MQIIGKQYVVSAAADCLADTGFNASSREIETENCHAQGAPTEQIALMIRQWQRLSSSVAPAVGFGRSFPCC
jgi:hypothetical protein